MKGIGEMDLGYIVYNRPGGFHLSVLHSLGSTGWKKTNHLNRMTAGFGTLRIFLVSDALSSVPLLLSILFGVLMSVKHDNTKNKKTGSSRESPVMEQRF